MKLLPKHGLTFDICVKHWALIYGIELARRCPEVPSSSTTSASRTSATGLREPWRGQIRETGGAAECRLQGLGRHHRGRPRHWSKEEVKPYIAHVIDAFGFDRVMYGSDWTVSELTHPYPAFVELLDEILAGASEAEQAQALSRHRHPHLSARMH